MIIKACPGHPLLLGRLGENLAREIVFVDEVAAWLSEYPNAAIGLLNQRPGDTQGYPVARAVVSGGALHWTVTNTDLSAEGNGRCELVATDNGVVVKSAIYDTIILTALDGSGETPEPWEDWREYFIELKDEAEGSAEAAAGSATAAGQSAADAGTFSAAAQAARDGAEAAVSQVTNLQASAETLEPGSDATAQYDAQTGVLTLGIPKGDPGATGPQGDPGEDYILTEADKAEIAGMVNVPVTDVQVDGSSVVSAGVANVPIATSNTPGVVTVKDGLFVGSTGHLYINRALDAQIKAAVDDYKPIVPRRQHISAFYGLAKAAGDTTQAASDNAIGVYTDEARKAIKKMLGIYDEWELIADVTVEEDSATFVIDTDIEGQGFALSQMLVRIWLESATTGQNDNVGTTSLGVNVAGADVNANSLLVRYVGGGAATYMELKYELVCGASLANTSAAALPQSTAYLSKATSAADNIAYYRGFRLKQQSASTSLIPSGSIVKIYGIRM